MGSGWRPRLLWEVRGAVCEGFHHLETSTTGWQRFKQLGRLWYVATLLASTSSAPLHCSEFTTLALVSASSQGWGSIFVRVSAFHVWTVGVSREWASMSVPFQWTWLSPPSLNNVRWLLWSGCTNIRFEIEIGLVSQDNFFSRKILKSIFF